MTFEGYGAGVTKSANIITVTNLNDSGAGSLRAAIDTVGAKTIRFTGLSGTITLQTNLLVTDNTCIEGQTASNGGICIKTDPSMLTPAIRVTGDNIILQYLRVRPGASTLGSNELDSLNIRNGDGIMIDHCSFSWATDEVASCWSSGGSPINVTFQWCIFSEGLHNSTHLDEGQSEPNYDPHSMGLILGSTGAKQVTVHHCLFAHNNGRNPYIINEGWVDFRNCVIYNWGDDVASRVDETNQVGAMNVNVVGNYYKAGVDVGAHTYVWVTNGTGGDKATFYFYNNITPWRTVEDPDDQTTGVVDPARNGTITETEHVMPAVETTDANTAYTDVLCSAGAILPRRDAVDIRIVNDVKNGTGSIVDVAGTYPTLTRSMTQYVAINDDQIKIQTDGTGYKIVNRSGVAYNLKINGGANIDASCNDGADTLGGTPSTVELIIDR